MAMDNKDPEETMRRAEEAVARAFASPSALGRRPSGSGLQRSGMNEGTFMSQMAMATAVSIPQGKPPSLLKAATATKAFSTNNGPITASVEPVMPPSKVGVGRTIQQRSFSRPTTPQANPVPGTAEFVKNSPPRSTRGAASKSANTDSATPTSSDLDLKRNDNAFHVVANLVLDRLLRKVKPGATSYTLDAEDRVFFDEMVPSSVRHAFVDAVRYRIHEASTEQSNLVAKLTDQCCKLGLDKEEESNILLNSQLETATVAGSVVSHVPSSMRSIRGGSVRGGGSVVSNNARGRSSASVSSSRRMRRSISPLFRSTSSVSSFRRDSPRKRRSISPLYRPNSVPGTLSPAEKRDLLVKDEVHRKLEEKKKILDEEEKLKEKQAELQQQKLREQAEQIRAQAEQIKKMQEAVATQLLKEKAMKKEQEARLKEQQEALLNERMLKAQQDQLLKEQQEILEKEKSFIDGELSSTMVSGQSSLLDDPETLHIQNATRQGLVPRDVPGGDLLITSEVQASTTESLARMQIMTEIKEATNLMNESVSADTANFWKAHVEELQNRLQLMNKELSGANSPQVPGGVTGQLQYQEKVIAHYGGDPEKRLTREEYLEANRKMAEEHFGNVSSTRDIPLADAEPVNIPNATYVEMRSLEGMPKTREESFTAGGAAPLVDVVSPADLPEGYVFEAQLGNKKFLATVPAGGVKRGAMFSCPMRELDAVEIDVPRGQWKDTIFDCFQEGFFHALFCNALFLPHLALGQIMSRNYLNSLGSPGTRFQSKTAFTNMVTFAVFWFAINALAFFAYHVQWRRGFQPTLADIIVFGVFNGAMAVCTVLIVSRTRRSIREKYELPEVRCHGREDIMCATFCMPCTICQLGRHTSDYDTYRAACCTDTGLSRHVQLKQVPTSEYPSDHVQFA